MTKSSTEAEKVETAPAAETKDQPKVPVAAIGAARAQTRAARDEVERLQEELAKAQSELQAQSTKVDPAAMSEVVAQMMVETRQKVEAEVRASMDAEVQKFKFAAKMGLNEKQVDSVTAMQAKHPGLAVDQALLLARAAAPDLFPANAQTQPAWNRALHGGLPVTGASEARSEAKVDYTAEMHKAAAAKDWQGAQQFAAKEFVERLYISYPHMRPRSG
jgi:hypothetical protein